jgi:hypothetical protein
LSEIDPHGTHEEDLVWTIHPDDLPTGEPVQQASITASLQTWNGESAGLPDVLSVGTEVAVHRGDSPDTGVTAEEAATIAMNDPRASYYLSLWSRSPGRTASISHEGDDWVITAATTQGAAPLTVTVNGSTGQPTSVKVGQAEIDWPPSD